MADMLFHAHSGLRYLVLLAGVAAIIASLIGWLRPPTRPGPADRIPGAAFVGLLDLQILLGIVLLTQWRFYGQLMGHIVMMIIAALVAHIGSARAKRRTVPAEAAKLRALTFAAVLLLIVAGILAIQRAIV